MRLSTKGRFAVTAMMDVALREHAGPVSLSDIATRHKISLSYLEQMFSKLRQHGWVDSTRGPGGGYSLGHRLASITVADIIGSVEDDAEQRMGVVPRPSNPAGQDSTQDLTLELWDTLNSKMLDYMQSITLLSLVQAQRAKGQQLEVQKLANRGVFKQAKPESLRAKVPNSVFALGQAMLIKV